jgi:hypothetical protein
LHGDAETALAFRQRLAPPSQESTVKLDKSNPWAYALVWAAAAALAVVFALASPTESRVMGHFPVFMSRTLTNQPVLAPGGLPADRTLALITFHRGQRAQADSWIQGLNLNNDSSITWLRMPVFNDPGTPLGRNAAENRLLQHYPAPDERSRLVPVFTDRADFVRSAGLTGIEQSSVVIVNRHGEVLARVEGQYDAVKAQTLRETLKAQGL